MNTVRRAFAGVSALALVMVLALLSGAPYTAESAQRAIIRLSWRARGERERRCRRPTPEELEKLPPHMRPQEICERGSVPYRLRVRLDDSLAVDALVRAGGAQGDRPLFVFAEVPAAPGTHHLSVVFEREHVDQGDAEHDDEEADHDEGRDVRETPRHLALDQVVTLAPRVIVLVTYDDERQRLVLLAGGGGAP